MSHQNLFKKSNLELLPWNLTSKQSRRKLELADRNSISQVYCIKHKQGPFNKDSQLQKEHEKKSRGKCDIDNYSPRKHNKKYNDSKIVKRGKKSKTISDDEDNRTDSQKVYEFAQNNIIKLVRSFGDKNRVYAVIKTKNHFESLEIGAWESIQWLKSTYYSHCGDFFNDELYKNALSLITAHSINDKIKIEKIYIRSAFVDDTLFYDLCDDQHRLVKITKDGYSIIDSDVNTPIFRRKSNQVSQIIPKKNQKIKDPLEELVSLLRIQPIHKHLFKMHLACFFLESFPMPVMIVHGEQDSAKSTITSTVKRIIDPSPENRISFPKKADDFYISVYNRYVSNFDNISYFDQEASDNICKVITGTSYSKRELYQNSKEIILNVQSKIILNGITPNIEFPDLMRRSIFYETKFIPEKERLTEVEFNKKLGNLLPSVLDQIFNTLSESIKIYDVVNHEIKEKKNMSDFLIFGECASRILGYEKFSFVKTYKNNQESILLNAVDTWPIINILTDKLKDKQNGYEISIDDLHKDIMLNIDKTTIDTNYKHSKFPKTPSILSSQITKLNPVFRNLGCILTISKYNLRDGKHPRGRKILRYTSTQFQSKLESTKTASSASPASPNQKQAQNSTKSGEALKTSTSSASSVEINTSGKQPSQNMTTQAQKKNTDKARKSKASPKNDKFTPKNSIGEGDEVGEPVFEVCTVLDKNTHFKCNTCGSGWFEINETSRLSDEKLLDIHKKQGHKIEYSVRDDSS